MEETALHIEPIAAEREWMVEGIPVLSASILLPQAEPKKDRTARRIQR